MKLVRTPKPTVDMEAVRTHLHTALRKHTTDALWDAVVDIPVLLAELDRVLWIETRARFEFANLLAAARAALAAADSNETDPLYLLRDEVSLHRALTPEEIDEWAERR